MYLATCFINKFLCKYVTCLIVFIPKDSPFSHFCFPFGSLFPPFTLLRLRDTYTAELRCLYKI